MADAFSLIPPEYASSDGFWIGRLSTAQGEAARMIANHDPKAAQKYLTETLAAFVASPVPSEELRRGLRGYL